MEAKVEKAISAIGPLKALDDDIRAYLQSVILDGGPELLESAASLHDTIGPFLESGGVADEMGVCGALVKALGGGSAAPADASGEAGGGSSSSRRRRRNKGGAAAAPAAGAGTALEAPTKIEKLDGPVKLGEMSREGDEIMSAVFSSGPDRTSQANQSTLLGRSDADTLKAEKRAAKERRRAEIEERRRTKEAELERKRTSAPVMQGGIGASVTQDIHVLNFTMAYGPNVLLENAEIKFVKGRVYGLVGRNGMGKTTLLRHISEGEVEGFPRDVRVMHVEQEVVGDEASVLATVLSADTVRTSLMAREKELLAVLDAREEGLAPATPVEGKASEDDDATVTTTSTAAKPPKPRNRKTGTAGMGKAREAAAAEAAALAAAASRDPSEELMEVYAKLDLMDASSAEARAASILAGLQFSPEMQALPTKALSGGWRMRVALAAALFLEPDLLLLDEPTNHLDFGAVIWLGDYINESLQSTVVVVSHDRAFLNTVCTDIIHLHSRRLAYYSGDYETFQRTREERRLHQHRAHESLEAKKKHIQSFIDKFRFNAKRASLVQSRIKALDRLGSVADVEDDPLWRFSFPDPGELGVPMLQVIDVAFGYNPAKPLFTDVSFGIHMDSRIGILGKNGAGKSTLLNLILGELHPQEGHIARNSKLRVATFTQHHIEQLDLKQSPAELLASMFPGSKSDDIRSHLGRFGLSGDLALQTIGTLSGGQKSRVAFSIMTWRKPHLLIMDEPTNHLDADTCDALIMAIGDFEGGVVVVSHDQFFLENIVDELWVVEGGKVNRFDGGLAAYRKATLKAVRDL